MTEKLRVFEAHGVNFTGESGDQRYGTCPFTGRANKFYVNVYNGLWDSKTAGLSGNIPQFLEHIQELYVSQLTPALLNRLAEDRCLPVEAFTPWNIGWNGRVYTIPIRNLNGSWTDIRMYQPGKRAMATAGASVGLLGSERLGGDFDQPVYICEGEWDTIALHWLLRRIKAPGIVVGVPGAGIFKQEWAPWFAGRTVHTLFDYDEAGDNAELVVQKRLTGVASSITYVHWPESVKSGFDVRDWVVYGAVERKTHKACYLSLWKHFKTYPRKGTSPALSNESNKSKKRGDATVETVRPSKWVDHPPSYEDVITVFGKWLFLDSPIAIEMMLAVVVSQQIEGPPIWMFLVAPPGGAKTETLTSLSRTPNIYMTSSLTPHALISGANWKGDQDPSLIPHLDGMVLVIKDFTAIMAMRDAEKDEIFGILRDAYDGRCGKVFGTGVRRSYESRFTLLAAVTPSIYDLGQQHHSLGERFLKCAVGDNLIHTSERDIIRRAIDNINHDTEMKWELQDVVSSFLATKKVRRLPKVTSSMKEKLIDLGMFGARLRGTVSHDQYRPDIITSRPSAEVGTRLGVQLAKLAKSLAVIHGKEIVDDAILATIRKVVLDTVSQRVEDVVRTIYLKCPTADDTIDTKDLALATRYPLATIQRLLSDLNVLEVVDRFGTQYKHSWTLSNYIRGCIGRAGLYQQKEERQRATRQWIRVVRRRGRKPKDWIGEPKSSDLKVPKMRKPRPSND